MKILGYQVTKATQKKSENNLLLRSLLQMIGSWEISPNESGKQYLEKAYEYNATVFSIVNYICSSAGMVPWVQYQKKKGKKFKYKGFTPQTAISKSNTLEEVEVKGLTELLERPNPMQTWPEFIFSILGYYYTTGNAYIYKLCPVDGQNKDIPKELWVLPSQHVRIESGGFMQPVKNYKLEFSTSVIIPSDQVIHLKNWNPNGWDSSGDWLYGMSPLKAASKVILRNNQAVEAGAQMFANHGAKGILTEESTEEGMGLDPAQMAEVEQKYYEKYGNVKNLGKILITAGKWKFHQMGLSPVDLAIIDSEKWDISQIANVFKFPIELLNSTEGSALNSSNKEEAIKQVYTKCIMPVLDMLKDALNTHVVKKYGDDLIVMPDYMSIPELQNDFAKMSSWLGASWWISGDEKREYMGWGVTDLPEMKVPLIPSGYTPLIDFDFEKQMEKKAYE